MKPSFAKKLTASYLFVVAATLLITGAFLSNRLSHNFRSNVEQSLASQAILMRELATPVIARDDGSAAIQNLTHRLGQKSGCRVTIVRADGVVRGDSDRSDAELAAMDNHRTRPEIAAALASGTGESTRYSRTLKEDMLYVAVPVDAGHQHPWGVLRVALPLTEVHRRVSSFRKDLLKAGAAAMVLALVIGFVVARRTTRPLDALASSARDIGEGRYPQELTLHSRDEFGQLASAFSEMSGRIEDKVQELSMERTQLATILAALVEGVVAVDHEGRLLFMNVSAEKLFGVRSQDMIGRPILEVLRHNPFQEVVQETFRSRQPVSQEIMIHVPQERLLSVQALPVSYGEERTGVLAALHDISELRKLERIRQEFVANVSHELKTPLTAIKGYVETLLDGALDDKQHSREFLEIIEEHSKHLGLLIDDVLDLSAIEAKRVEYHFEPVSLADVTHKLIKGLAPMAKAKKVTIDNQLSDDLPKAYADRDKLAQILMNLIDNAIKFNKEGGKIEIGARKQDTRIEVSVKDTGVGIAADDLPRVFERFYRADKARSHEIAGTGLGLAIVKHLVEAQQGAVKVESRVGEGTTFSFTLPSA